MISGILKLAVLVFFFLLAVFLAFQLLEINMDFSLGSLTCKYNLFNHKGTNLCDINAVRSCELLRYALVHSGGSLRLYYKASASSKIFEYFWVFQPDLCHKTKAVSLYLNFPFMVLYFSLVLFFSTPSLTKFSCPFFAFTATKQLRYKCGLSKACPSGHFTFKLASGAATVVGPRMCLEDKL